MGQGRKTKKLARRTEMIASVEADASVAHLPKWKRMREVAKRLTSNALAKRQRHKNKMIKKKEIKQLAAAAKHTAANADCKPIDVVPVVRSDLLLVLDVDGVLLQRESRPASGKPPKGWENVPTRPWRIKVRPDAAAFVRFCLANFTVGVWSAMSIENLQPMLAHVLGATTCKELLFIWGRDRTTPSGEYDPKKPGKETVHKSFTTLWGQCAGAAAFKPSKTLLIDDDAYKSEGNPPNTSIHPKAWDGKKDRYLKKKSPLRRWLQGLAHHGDVPAYVASTPFAEAVAQSGGAKALKKEQRQQAESHAHEEGKTTKRERRRLAQEAVLGERHARGEETRGDLKRAREAQRKEERASKRAKALEL